MSPNFIFYSGIAICVVAAASAVVGMVGLHISKKRLNRQLDAEYGKRRH